MARSENKMREILDAYLTSQKEIEHNQTERLVGVFLWGAMCGAILSYTSLLPLAIGGIFGYTLAKRNISAASSLFNRVAQMLEITR